MEKYFTFSLPYPFLGRDIVGKNITVKCIGSVPWFVDTEIGNLLGYIGGVKSLIDWDPQYSSFHHTPNEMDNLISVEQLEIALSSIDTVHKNCDEISAYWQEEDWLKNIAIPSSREIAQKSTEEDRLKCINDTLLKILLEYKKYTQEQIDDEQFLVSVNNNKVKKCKEVLIDLLKEL